MAPEIWSMTDRIFCHLGLFFCLFTLPNNPKSQNFEEEEEEEEEEEKTIQSYHHFI